MDPAIAATLVGILVAALLGVFASAFHLLRSDIRRVENKLDGLIMALARSGHLTEARLDGPTPPFSTSEPSS